jgi:hypothetical protein
VRVAACLAVLLLAVGCVTPPPAEVSSFTPLPGFEPNEELCSR